VTRAPAAWPHVADPPPQRSGWAGRRERARLDVDAVAEAELSPPGGSGAPAARVAGEYSGPLARRQGKQMRPDMAAAFDRMEAAARADGVTPIINSALRSNAEQAALFARNPDPKWVAPPGRSLHRLGTELDIGLPSAYARLAANGERFTSPNATSGALALGVSKTLNRATA
jgi:LAS superfamily LD-carboxypeptidase LdcB